MKEGNETHLTVYRYILFNHIIPYKLANKSRKLLKYTTKIVIFNILTNLLVKANKNDSDN